MNSQRKKNVHGPQPQVEGQYMKLKRCDIKWQRIANMKGRKKSGNANGTEGQTSKILNKLFT